MIFENFFGDAKIMFPQAEEEYNYLKGNWEEVDGVYRIYNKSFKMYDKFQTYIISALNVLFTLTDTEQEKLETKIKNYKPSIEPKLNILDLDKCFTRTILDALDIPFCPEPQAWYEHQKKLTSAAYHCRVGLESIMAVAENYYKNDYLPGENGSLTEYEILAIFVLNFSNYKALVNKKEVKIKELN
jgi:hypothetical protein